MFNIHIYKSKLIKRKLRNKQKIMFHNRNLKKKNRNLKMVHNIKLNRKINSAFFVPRIKNLKIKLKQLYFNRHSNTAK